MSKSNDAKSLQRNVITLSTEIDVDVNVAADDDGGHDSNVSTRLDTKLSSIGVFYTKL